MRKFSWLFVGLTMAVMPLLAQQAAPPSAAPVPKPASLDMFVYAKNNQDATQQNKDEVECYGWARQQTGFDPMAPAAAASPQAASGPDGSAVRGAARGAAKGAIIGEVANDDASEGAAVGAAAGAVKGRRQAKKQKAQAQQKAEQQGAAQAQQTKDTFKKAWGACLDGKGYSVK